MSDKPDNDNKQDYAYRNDRVGTAYRARSRRISLAFILSMSVIFGVAMFVIYLEDQSETRKEREQLDETFSAFGANEPMVEHSATGSPLVLSFDPDPFAMRESAKTVDPQVVAKAMAEVRVAHQYLLNGELDWAEKHARQALDVWPDMNTAQRLMGVIYIRRAQYDQAVAALEAALRTDPFNAETYNSLATVYMHQEQMAKAEELLQSALNIRPRYSVAHYNLGLLYLVTQNDRLAIEHLEQSLQQFGNEPGMYNNLGVAHMRLHAFDKARRFYQKAIDRWPENPPPYFNCAISYVRQGRFDKALEWVRKGAEISTPLDFKHYLDDPDFDPLNSHPQAAKQIEAIYQHMINVPEAP